MASTKTRYQARLAAHKAAGGSAINLLMSKDATDALDTLTTHRGETKTAVIERLLMQAAARITKRECKR